MQGNKNLYVLIICFSLFIIGCSGVSFKKKENNSIPHKDIHLKYTPEKVKILPLTEITSGKDARKIEALISLLDKYNSQVKAPAVFRFELFEYVERSPEPKGKRVHIWSDKDLKDPEINNELWNDYLRAYEFQLDLNQIPENTYILQITCICPDGKRLKTAEKIKI